MISVGAAGSSDTPGSFFEQCWFRGGSGRFMAAPAGSFFEHFCNCPTGLFRRF